MDFKDLIKEAHQEAHLCNSSKEVHDWIDWFEENLKENECYNKHNYEVLESKNSIIVFKRTFWFQNLSLKKGYNKEY